MKKLFLHLSNKKGVAMVELLIASVLGVFLLGTTINIFTQQQKIFEDESSSTYVRASGRIAVQLLTQELRKAGYGFPSGRGITNADSTAITIRANTDEVSSWITSEIVGGIDTNFTVRTGEAVNFAVNDKIVIFNTSGPSSWETGTIQTVNTGTDTITLTAALTNSYSTSDANIVNKYHDIIFSLDNANNQITKSVDGGAAMTLTGDVSANGLDFDYYDNTNTEITAMPVAAPANIRKVEIRLNMLDEDNSDATVTLETEVNIRNMEL